MSVPARVLVVDDDANVAITIQAVLEQEGYHVRGAFSADAAKELLSHELFDAALVDLRIDDVDGIELIRDLHTAQPHCSAIILTGYASLESAVRAIREGAYDYLVKPCDLNELRLMMARAVERSLLRRALEARVGELEDANATIRALNADLERRIEERTEELVQAVGALSVAQDRLEAVHRQRLEFVSMVAHELGQPLTTVLGSAQLLTRTQAEPEKRQRLVDTIVSESRRLNRLVGDLSDVARLSTGRFPIEPVEVDLAALLSGQVDMVRASTPTHTLEYDGPPTGVPVLADPDRVEQVIANLLNNALKYSDGGTVRVHLSTRAREAAIAVEDEGPGVPLERREQIFEPHVRLVAEEGGAVPAGTGLGLYIARGIAEAHGGRLWVDGNPAGGSTFTFTLPLAGPP